MVVLERLDHVIDDALVPVVATEVGVARGRLDLEDAVAQLEQRDVESAAAQVEHEDRLVALGLVEPVSEARRGRLVDETEHFEPRDLAGLLGRLTLRIVEVRGDGDDRFGHRVAEVGLGVRLELHEDAGGQFLWGPRLAPDVDLVVGPHLPLDRADRAIRIRDGLALGHFAHQHVPVLGERDDTRGRPAPLGVGDDPRLAALENGNDGVGGAQVDPYCLSHVSSL